MAGPRTRKDGDTGRSSPTASSRSRLPQTEEAAPRGINRIPRWLRQDVGLSDWLAGSIVIVAGGILMTIVLYLLILIWPAG